jgi:hypothetical protein
MRMNRFPGALELPANSLRFRPAPLFALLALPLSMGEVNHCKFLRGPPDLIPDSGKQGAPIRNSQKEATIASDRFFRF